MLGDWVQDSETDDKSQPDSYELLSPREKEVLRLVALGYTNRQVAEQLYLSIKTVGTYRARLMTKLNLKGRPALVRYALKRGLLEDSAASEREQVHSSVPGGDQPEEPCPERSRRTSPSE